MPPNVFVCSLPQTQPVPVISLVSTDVFAQPCLIVTVQDSGDGDLRRALTLVPQMFPTIDLLVSDVRKGFKLTEATVLAIAEPNGKGWLTFTVSAAKDNVTPIGIGAATE
jgi:hypothetical protein